MNTRKDKPGQWLQWMNLGYNEETVWYVKEYAAMVKGRFDNILVLGIGGSALGGIAVCEALLKPYWNLLTKSQRNNNPRIFFLDNIDPDQINAMLDMLDDKTQWVGQVDASRVEMLRKVTNDYLSIYLADKPEAWKWIFLTCAYNSFIREIPMHPQEFVKYQTIVKGDQIFYVCPSKSLDPNTSCAFCVCGKLLGEGTQTFDVEIQD